MFCTLGITVNLHNTFSHWFVLTTDISMSNNTTIWDGLRWYFYKLMELCHPLLESHPGPSINFVILLNHPLERSKATLTLCSSLLKSSRYHRLLLWWTRNMSVQYNQGMLTLFYKLIGQKLNFWIKNLGWKFGLCILRTGMDLVHHSKELLKNENSKKTKISSPDIGILSDVI